MKKANTISVPSRVKTQCALMKDQKRSRSYLKLMADALQAELNFKNRKYSDKGDASE